MRHSLLVLFAVLLLPVVAQAAVAPKVPAQDAYSEVIGWGMGLSGVKDVSRNKAKIGDVNERLERAAYRYGVVKEFAMAVVSTEAYLQPHVSYARSDSWAVYEKATQYKMPRYPDVMTDLDTALSTLVGAMQKGKTVEQVLTLYWCGPGKSINTGSLPQFIEYVNKIYNGLEPYARQRLQAERSGKVKPSSSDFSEYFDDEFSGWGVGSAVANKDGFKSKLGTRPMRVSDMVYFKGHEEAYAAQVKKFNKSISDSQAKLISRAILNYCNKTNWEVDPRFVMALVAAESRFKTNAVSSAGALGLGQLMPATARAYGVSNAFDPVQNLYGCVKYIEREQHRWARSGNRHDLILAAYNAGPGAVKKYGGVPPYRETQNYVKTVKKYYKRFCS
ncbi:MAG: lytic transglycosylase domain-containing protein [bacterium]|nr:lytic transglycosylase domain-containing protein [bacterium]